MVYYFDNYCYNNNNNLLRVYGFIFISKNEYASTHGVLDRLGVLYNINICELLCEYFQRRKSVSRRFYRTLWFFSHFRKSLSAETRRL